MDAHSRKQAEKQRKDEVAVGKFLSEIQAVSIIGGFCRANTLNVTFEEDLAARRLDFQITDKDGLRVAHGTVSHCCPSGFPVKFIFPRGSLEIVSAEALRQCLAEAIGSPEPETYRTDRHSVVGVALCPRCLRTHDPSKPIECECGYRTVSVADPNPIPPTNPQGHLPVTVLTAKFCGNLKIDWSDVELSELHRHRDRLNEIIYDREQGKCQA